MMTRSLSLGLAATLLLASPLDAQHVRPTPLGTPEATFPEPVSSPIGVRVLSDGRVLVADNIEGTVSLLDFRSGAMTPVGRQGDGPGEYGMPGPLFEAAGDTTYMLDMGNRRLLVIGPDGRIASTTIPLRHSSGWPILPRGVDAKGRVYFDLAGIVMPGLNEMAAAGRAPLLRWDRSTDAMDTVAFVQFPPLPPARPGEMRISIGGGAYQPADQWSVMRDGRVGLARATGYRVEWHGGPRPIAGPEVRYDPIKIGTAEKNAWADLMASRGVAVEVENGRRRTRRLSRPDISQVEWPDVMPPFNGSRAVLASPQGELWVRRSQPANARIRVYDVFDGQGRLVRQVSMEGERSVLAFGAGAVYVARTDADDLVWLERYER